MKTTILKNIFAAALIMSATFATIARADDDQWVAVGENETINSVYELNLASIEQISPTVKRVVTRHRRLDPNQRPFLKLPSSMAASMEYIEMVSDIDCKTPRIKTLQEVKVYKDGRRVKDQNEEIPVFVAVKKGTLTGMAREKACSTK